MATFMRALRLTSRACTPSVCSALGREQAVQTRLPIMGLRCFSVLPTRSEEKELTAWGYAFIGLGYLAMLEGMYYAYRRYTKAEVRPMRHGLARDDLLWHKPGPPNDAPVDRGQGVAHLIISRHAQTQTPGSAKERLLRIHEVIQGIADKTGSHTAKAHFLDGESMPETLRKLIDEVNEELRSSSKPELSLTALTEEAAHKMKEIVQKFKETLEEGATRQGPLEEDGRFYFIDPDLDLVIEYDW